MSGAAKSLFVFGIYILALSLFLIVDPNLFLNLFGFPPTNEVWLRVAGLLLLFLGFYDVQAARAELQMFFKWSIYTRGSVIFFFTVFVLLGLARPTLILFGVVDFLSAIWTSLALRANTKRSGRT
jgi:hypothetical protein